jgi:predicted O-methyltransferase YrrM
VVKIDKGLRESYTKEIDIYIRQSKLEVPSDLIAWSYRWRCYIYSNILAKVLSPREITDKERDIIIYLLSKVREEHASYWVREKFYPLSEDAPFLDPSSHKYNKMQSIVAANYFNKLKIKGEYVADEFMLEWLPELRAYVEEGVEMPELKEKKKAEKEYRLSPKFNFWEPDHHKEFNRLKDIFGGSDNLKFLEIGTFEGRTAVWLLDNVLTGKNCHLTCVDADPPDNLKHNLSFHEGKVTHCREYSNQWFYNELSDGAGGYDFVYVDGDHNAPGVLEDIIHAWRALKVGGYLYLDDYEMEIRDPWFYIMHPEFLSYDRLNFIHPHVGIDAFLSNYRGQYEIVFKNYLVGLKKITEIGDKNLNHGDNSQPEIGI